jgi:hypothetical protein
MPLFPISGRTFLGQVLHQRFPRQRRGQRPDRNNEHEYRAHRIIEDAVPLATSAKMFLPPRAEPWHRKDFRQWLDEELGYFPGYLLSHENDDPPAAAGGSYAAQ